MGEFINVLVSKGKSNLIPEKDNLYGQFVGEWDLNGLITKVQQAKDMFRESGYSLGCWKGLQFKMCLFALRVRHGLKIIKPDAAYATAVRMYNPNTEAWGYFIYGIRRATQLEGKEKETGLFRRKLMRRIYSGCFRKLQRPHSVGNVW